MHLYNLTLSRPSAITTAVYGNFSAPKAQEVAAARGRVLELLRPDDAGKMQVVCSVDVFGAIRSLAPFRLTGASRDYLVVGSDSGRIIILDYDEVRGAWKKVHQETFGKSGCRRVVPGQYLATDPKGRAVMIGAVEKQKFVYVLNRDAAANLTISSPLEAHKSHNIVFALAGLDMGYDNPVFAAIELDYADADQDPTGEAAAEAQKHLTLYELDLGLNHVVRKWSEPVDNGANLLVPVPGGGDGPGGVLVCAENFVIYKNQDHADVRAVIPRRADLPGDRGVLIVAHAMHRQKTMFFALLQSEYGDLYKVTLTYAGEAVSDVTVKYFDTIPPCSSICVLKTGFLFAASEFGNHALYQFTGIGDDDSVQASASTLMETEDGFAPVHFEPRGLQNLALIDEAESLSPMLDLKVANLLGEEIPQLYAACGRGARSTLRVLRPGAAVTEMAVSPLPGNPTAVFTVRRAPGDEYDAFIVVSFTNATLVLAVGETVEEVSDSGFLGTAPTLTAQLLADGSMLQVHPGGLRHIRADGRVNEWRAPGRRAVTRAATNERQAVVALAGGELVLFEMNQMGQLAEVEKREMGGDVSALDLLPVPEGRARARFLAVGSYDATIRVLSLDPEDTLKVLAVQAAGAAPESLLMLDSPAAGAGGGAEGAGAGALFLHAGLANGVLLRTEVDHVTGQLSDTRTRFLGTRPPRLFPVIVRGARAMLALSSRPWLAYSDAGRHNLVPLTYETLDHAAGFASEACPEGFAAVAGGTLRILALERLGEGFNQQATRLRYTPRKLLVHDEAGVLIVAEADHAAVPLAVRSGREGLAAANGGEGAAANGGTLPPELDDDAAAAAEQFGAPRGAVGQWASCVRIVDPRTLETTSVLELDDNEAALCMALVSFTSATEEGTLLAVGTAQGLAFYPRRVDDGFIRLYRLRDGGRTLELVHKTAVGGIPGALAAFRGRLLAGVGGALRLYDLGRKKLLRKCEHRSLPTHIVGLATLGDRVYVSDQQESVHYFKYKRSDNAFYEFADDVAPRHVTASLVLDYDTVAGADKFGNVFALRLGADASASVEADPTGGKFAGALPVLGASHKLDAAINFHVGDTVTALQRAALQPGGVEAVVYGTLGGGVGALLPLASRPDIDFFSHLEMHLRQEAPPLCGRDHMAYRSAYFPVRHVVDGDLCEQYAALPADKQRSIAAELDRTPGEVLKKLEDVRNKVL